MEFNISSIGTKYGLFFIFLGLIILSSLLSPLFFTYANLANFFSQIAYNGILSIGMTFVIIMGGIDLSVGSIVGFSSILYATILHGAFFTFMPKEIFIYGQAPTLNSILPFPFDVFFVLFIGGLIGYLNGAISYRFRINSFIVTLCMMIFIRGLGICYTNGQPLFGVPDLINSLAYGAIAKVPMPTIIWIFIYILAGVLLRYSRFGRAIYSVGGDKNVARLSGIEPAKYQIFPYVVSGLLAALVGIMMSGRMGCGDPKIADGWQTDAIAAVVIGGASMTGGKGSVTGTILGVLILGLITNIMNLLKIDAYPQQMAKGFIIIGALALQGIISGRRGK